MGMPGNAQAGRIALAAAGVEWDNEFVNQETWPGVKTSGRPPFGQAPFLDIEEKDGSKWSIAQSHTITRYVCNRYGAKRSDQEAAIIDSLTERAADMKSSFSAAVPWSKPAEEKKALAQKWVDENFATFSANLDKFLGENKTGSGFLVGATYSAADIFVLRLHWSFHWPRCHRALDGCSEKVVCCRREHSRSGRLPKGHQAQPRSSRICSVN